ncbi:uncharacterized protein LOC133206409 [Saccostrea echinata]|uniref:uncharacterized protein LOC133206409 n=1 Tax=Saccostrea echinata TaxID=191078 RepID=UPI002A7EFC1D|nr:uncharacterized protein LOC133206409 [Saccostrea echinata]
MALNTSVRLVICWLSIAFLKECDAAVRYSYYRYYYYSYTNYYYSYYSSSTSSSSVGLYVGIVFGIAAFCTLVSIVICCLCCRRRQNTSGIVLTNPSTQQTIVTSNVSAGVTYPQQPNQYDGQCNTAFHYGMGAPGQTFDNSSAPQNDESAPSYESVVGQNGPISSSFPMQENVSNTTCSLPYKT